MKLKHKGFVLVESLTSLAISLLIIFMLTYCVSEQFKLLDGWEQRVNAHKIILLHLSNPNLPAVMIIKGQKYYFQQTKNNYQVSVRNNVYQVEIKT